MPKVGRVRMFNAVIGAAICGGGGARPTTLCALVDL